MLGSDQDGVAGVYAELRRQRWTEECIPLGEGIDDNTMNMVVKKDGKVVANGTIIVAPDGKSRRVKVSSADPKITGLDQNAVYDKK